MKNWLVVANAARARVLEDRDEPDGPTHLFDHVADLVHPQSRQKGVALGDDRGGHAEGGSPGPAGNTYAPRTDPRQRERDRFAREVARLLDSAVASQRCAGLILVASNPFLGQLKSHLGTQAIRAVLRTVDADYTQLGEAELAARLAPGSGKVARKA